MEKKNENQQIITENDHQNEQEQQEKNEMNEKQTNELMEQQQMMVELQSQIKGITDLIQQETMKLNVIHGKMNEQLEQIRILLEEHPTGLFPQNSSCQLNQCSNCCDDDDSWEDSWDNSSLHEIKNGETVNGIDEFNEMEDDDDEKSWGESDIICDCSGCCCGLSCGIQNDGNKEENEEKEKEELEERKHKEQMEFLKDMSARKDSQIESEKKEEKKPTKSPKVNDN